MEKPDVLFARLNALEVELRTLRAELGDARTRPANLPSGNFHALTMKLGQDSYGAPIEWVREIVRYVELTRIADVPPFVVGTINYRGEILPVIDGRIRYGLTPLPPRRGTAIVLLRAAGLEAGVVVDAVRDVVELHSDTLRTPTGPLARAQAVAALATVGDEVIQMVDLHRIMSSAQWEKVRDAALSDLPPCEAEADDHRPTEARESQ